MTIHSPLNSVFINKLHRSHVVLFSGAYILIKLLDFHKAHNRSQQWSKYVAHTYVRFSVYRHSCRSIHILWEAKVLVCLRIHRRRDWIILFSWEFGIETEPLPYSLRTDYTNLIVYDDIIQSVHQQHQGVFPCLGHESLCMVCRLQNFLFSKIPYSIF